MHTLVARIVLAVVIAFAAGLSQAGEKLRIGLSLPSQQEERWARDLQAMRDEAEKLGVDLRCAVARNDQAQQNDQIEQLLAQGIRVLILAPHDGEDAGAAVRKAHEEGIRVIAYDRLIMGTEVDVYVSFDNVLVGELMGEWLAARAPRGDYVVMSGAPTDNNSRMFKQGHMKAIQPLVDRGDVRIVVDQPVIDWQPENARKIVESALTQTGGDIDAVLAPNDGAAAGAIAALEEWGLAGKVPVTGMDSERDAARRIVRGTQSITVLKDTRKLGQAAIRLAVKMASGDGIESDLGGRTVHNDRIDVPSLLLGAEVVDRDNLDAVLIESGYLTREQVYGE